MPRADSRASALHQLLARHQRSRAPARVQRDELLLLRAPHQREHVAAHARHHRLDDRQHRRRGDRRVDRVAAVLEHRERGRRRERLTRRRDAVRRVHRRSSGHCRRALGDRAEDEIRADGAQAPATFAARGNTTSVISGVPREFTARFRAADTISRLPVGASRSAHPRRAAARSSCRHTRRGPASVESRRARHDRHPAPSIRGRPSRRTEPDDRSRPR